MVTSSHVGPTLGRWSALDAIPEVEEAKHQRGNGWIWNWGHFELDFEFISWISKSFRNGPSTLCNCLQMSITSSFQLQFVHRLNRWTLDFPSFEEIYSMYKMDSYKYSKFVLKFRVYVAIRFWVLNFHATESCFMPHFPCFLAFFLTP